jgi:hypothetical protein
VCSAAERQIGQASKLVNPLAPELELLAHALIHFVDETEQLADVHDPPLVDSSGAFGAALRSCANLPSRALVTPHRREWTTVQNSRMMS